MMIRVCLIMLCLAFAASAATFNVTKTADTLDGLCDADCSLREAITAANLLPGDDVIVVPSGVYTTTIASTNDNGNVNGDFDITGNVRIVGEAQGETIIQANALPGVAVDRVFHILGTATRVVMERLTVRHGRTTNPAASFRGGGIRNEGDLTLRSVTVSNNETISRGGGITSTNVGTFLSLDRVNVVNNSAVATTTGTFGGGVFTNFSTVRIRKSNISQNNSIASVGANLTANGGGFYALDGDVTIRDTIVNGNVVSGTSSINSSDGGGLRFVGLNFPMTITLDGLTVTNNAINEGGSAGAGISIGTIEGATEAITATISNSVVNQNSVTSSIAETSGAGMICNGLGRTTINVEFTRFVGNTVTSNNPAFRGAGGAVYANNCTLNVRSSLFNDNTAELGGALLNESLPHDLEQRVSAMTIIGSSIENNAGSTGGGIINRATLPTVEAPLGGSAVLNLQNTTVSSNLALADAGGILQDQAAGTNAQTAIDNSTIAFNQANTDMDSTGDGGGIRNLGGNVTLKNSIVSGNLVNPPANRSTTKRKDGLGAVVSPDLLGAFVSADYNLFLTTTGATITGTTTNNIVGTDPGLLTLSYNGGFGRTHRLGAVSVARDAGDPVGCQDQTNNAVDFDQRGLPRSQGGARCDIGAVEEGGVVWDGGGADNNFTTAENWEGDIAPSSLQYAIFNATSGKDVSIDVPREVLGVIYGGEYTGFMSLDGGSLRVRDRFYLLGGNIVCNNGNFVDMAVDSSFVRHTGYIDGMVSHDFIPGVAETFNYPTGNAAGYFPATVGYSPPQRNERQSLGASTLSVRPVDATLPGVNPAQSLGVYWNIESFGVNSASLTLSYEDDVVATNANENDFRFIRREGETNTPFQATSADDFFNTFRLDGVDSFSDWTLGAFVPTAASATIAGRVTDSRGIGIRNATVQLSGGNLARPFVTRTGTFGFYELPPVEVGNVYFLTVGAKRYRFENPTRIVELQENISGVDFVSSGQ